MRARRHAAAAAQLPLCSKLFLTGIVLFFKESSVQLVATVLVAFAAVCSKPGNPSQGGWPAHRADDYPNLGKQTSKHLTIDAFVTVFAVIRG